MEFTSVADILKFAISKERASVRFFQDLGSKVQDPMTQSLMEVLTQKEPISAKSGWIMMIFRLFRPFGRVFRDSLA